MRKNYKLLAPPSGPILVKSLCVVSLSLFLAHCVLADQEAQTWVPVRTRVFSLRHIPAQKAKEYLTTLKIGDTISQLPVNNALIVTASPSALVKATSIVKLVDVDSEDEFVIKTITQGPDAINRPSNQQIANLLGDISIGTLLAPPTRKPAAIIDLHNDALILLAPKQQLSRITQAIEKLRTAADIESDKQTQPEASTAPLPAEPNQYLPSEPAKQAELQPTPEAEESQADTDLNELFDKLLESLAEAEKIAAEEASELEQQAGPAPLELVQEGEVKAETSPPALPEAKLPEPFTTEPAAGLEALEEEFLAEPEEIPDEIIPPVTEEMIIPNGDEQLELDLPEKVNIIALLDLVGKYLDLDYLYDPDRIRGDVTLKVRGPLKVKDLYALLESVLKFKGFAMSRKGNLVMIVPVSEALNVDPALRVDGETIRPGDVVMTRVFDLDYINTPTAKTLLTGMKLGAEITELPETNQLIITEFAYRMGRIEQLLDLVDQPGEPKQFSFRQLKYIMANTLTPKLITLVDQLGTVSISVATEAKAPPRRTRRGRQTPTPSRTTTTQKPSIFLGPDERTNRILMVGHSAEIELVNELIDAFDIPQQDLRIIKEYEIQYVDAQEVLDTLNTLGVIGETKSRPVPRPGKEPIPAEVLTEEAQVDLLELTNSLLINATPEQHEAIAMIIAYVDREPVKASIPYEIYPLENQDPKAMAEVLNELVEKTTRDKEGKVQAKTKQEDITIVADENTFSIIVYASKKNQEWIGNLIKNLDKRRPQVLIDVTLVEVSETDKFEYDLNIIANAEHAVTANIGGSLGLSTLTSSVKDTLELGFNSGSEGYTRGFYSSRHIQALIKAIQEKSYGRVLAKPKVLVNDNEEGKIVTTSTTNISITGTSTTEAGVTTQTQTYQPYTADIELIITPHISEGDLLRLEVSMKREDFDPDTLGGTTVPDKTRSEINTTVTVPDGKTIILGGLIKLAQGKGGAKVPLLGDIPLVGALFRNVQNTSDTSKLYVFVKANILRPGPSLRGLGQLEKISEKNRYAFEESEREFQEYRNLPGFPPDKVDPLHVLKEE